MTTENLNKNGANEPVTCTWDTNSECDVCPIHRALDCKWERKHLIRFYLNGLPFFIPTAIGMILTIIWTGNWTGFIIYAAFWMFFFGFFEIYVLCRHCPYYSEEGRILHCLANHGLLKIWKYNPGTMNRWEKAGLLIGLILFLGIPVVTFIFGTLTLYEAETGIFFVIILSGITFLTFGGTLIFGKNLVTKICPHCVNFSCPLNRVPKEVRDAYLKRNPVMKQAWEKTGYRLG
ncbi:MAG: hypothetical protein JSW11_04945 [Candidatus Heimdallarchaeota archaeon]|nr:MAG: hypothetical protein JSW11_04945 [Candidatus Heimdallarchaeota archaeon]